MAKRDLTGAIDFAHLETYTAGDPGIADEVLGLFEEQAALWTRLMTPDAPADSWRDAAHTLKGASLGIGAHAMAQACSEAELKADTGPAARAMLLDPVLTALNAVLADIAAWRHEQALQGLKS